MTVAFSDLASELTPDDILSVLFSLSDAAGLPISAQQPGESARSIFSIFSSWGSSLWNGTILRAIRAQFGETVADAGRSWATFWGLALYGVAPDDATFAEGPIDLTNTAGGNWSFAPGTFRVKNTLANKTFTNLEQITLPPWPGFGAYPQQLDVRFRADEAGSASTSTAGQIDALVTTANGVTVTNPSILAGQDEESLADFVVRARSTPALLSPNGPKAAYDAVLRRGLRIDGSKIAVNRVRVRTPAGNGIVRAIVASPSGAVASADVARLLTLAQTLLEPWGITIQIASAAPIVVPANITVWARKDPSLTGDKLIADATAALIPFFTTAPIGGFSLTGGDSGYIFVSELEAIASESNPAIFKAAAIGTDVAIGAEDVPVLGAVSITPVIV